MDQHYNQYIYSPSKSYGGSPHFVHSDGLVGTGFGSLYGITQSDAKAIIAEGTTALFKGVVGDIHQTLWIDTDTPEAAKRVEEKLHALGLAFLVFDSGGRGFHFGVHRVCQPSHLLPLRDKTWAVGQFGRDIDSSIYTHLHLFRLPGTQHESTGRTKVLLREVQGLPLALPHIERVDLPKSFGGSTGSSPGESVFSSMRVMAHTVPAAEGERHPTLVKLAYALRDDVDADPQGALWYMREVNKLFPSPKEDAEVEQVWQSIFEAIK